MYLYIFEDGSVKGTPSAPSEDDLMSVDDGYLSIINTAEEVPQEYYNGEWSNVDMLLEADKPEPY